MTLAQLFALATVGVALVVGVLLYTSVTTSRRSILASAEQLRASAADRIAARVADELAQPKRALGTAEQALTSGTASVDDPVAVEKALFVQVLGAPRLTEATFTRADRRQFAEDGAPDLANTPRWQVSVLRDRVGPRLLTQRTRLEGGRWTSDARVRPDASNAFDAPFSPRDAATDPTEHLTFRTTASKRFRGTPIWSDLHWAEADSTLPEARRRVVVTVQKAIEDASGRLLGVIRVGLATDELDAIVRAPLLEHHRVFLFDDDGRLVTRLAASDRIAEVGDDLRVVPASLPAEIDGALKLPLDARALEVGGRHYLTTFRALDDTHWNLGIVVPEEAYTRELESERKRLLFVYLGVVVALVVLGAWTVRALRRGLADIVGRTVRMREFDFAPAPVESTFADVEVALGSLERAKTATRALGKYVPVDLVRRLFEKNEEPSLGGALTRVSLMFTDIEGFTTLSERLSPNDLARALGLYLDAMTCPVQATEGTIDKFIGDAVMAIWNAPSEVPEHAKKACAAALACIEATRELYASPGWGGQPALFTRFGLHTDEVLVGHFGAPARMSYTALGDGVNLAARLEGLCKQYGVAILASDAVVEQAGRDFVFRKIDRVAVKGKSRAVMVYELVARRGELSPAARAYERALDAYFARDFAGALAILEGQKDDPPSAVLAERCAGLRDAPPGANWDGVYVARSK
jgi:adenylate cyclase